ncbi:unnamed protein product [Linum trigynum]|uniref:Uncharacterized protein n=1 Tax=Linum trigynum TaxID=586398 RepID=A0AAV2F6C2_9ROSI
MEGILTTCGCPLGRLSPSVIVIVILFKLRCREHHVEPTFNLFRYFFKMALLDNCLSLQKRKGRPNHFVEKCPKLGRSWFNGFFFMKAYRDSFFESGGAFLKEWRLGSVEEFNAPVELSQAEKDGARLICETRVNLCKTENRPPILEAYYNDGP